MNRKTSLRVEDWLDQLVQEYAKRNNLTWSDALHNYIRDLMSRPNNREIATRSAKGQVIDSGDHGGPVDQLIGDRM